MPAFELMPPWQDKSGLSEFVSSQGIAFSLQKPGAEASEFLAKGRAVDEKLPGYFIIQARKGATLIGAVDGYALQDTLVFMRSRALGAMRPELHSALYCAAMTYARAQAPQPKAAFYVCPKLPLSEDMAGKLLFLGRRAGMQALPTEGSNTLVFIRRIGKEYDFIADAKELAALLRSISAIFKLDAVISGLEGKGTLMLIPLPMSPDAQDRLHELEDTVRALGIGTANLAAVLEKLRNVCVYERKDVAPESF
jgi:hypothetical protein